MKRIFPFLFLALSAYGDTFPPPAGGGGGSGTVTSVGLAGTADQITVTGASPITDSGSWTLSLPFMATTALSTPAAPIVTKQGAGTGTTWGYELACHNAVGRTDPSAEGTVDGNATLDGSHTTTIATVITTGVTYCDIFRRTAGGTPNTTGWIGCAGIAPLNAIACQVPLGTGFVDTGLTPTGSDGMFASGNTTQGLGLGYSSFSMPLPVDGIDAVHFGTPLTNFSPYTQSNAWYIAPVVFAYKGNFVNGHSTGYFLSEDDDTGGASFITGALSTEAVSLGNNDAVGQYSTAENFGTSLVANLDAFRGLLSRKPGATVTNGIVYRAQNGNFGGSTDDFTNYIGFGCDDFSGTATRMSCLESNLSAGTGKWAFYGAGTAASKFGGDIVYVTPTSCSGKPAGTLWNDSGTVKVCP